MQDDDVSTAITRWMGAEGWKAGVELTATMLCAHLVRAMKNTPSQELSWKGKHLVLSHIIKRNLKVYEKRFGLKRGDSTLRSTRGNHTYCFAPTPEQLAEV